MSILLLALLGACAGSVSSHHVSHELLGTLPASYQGQQDASTCTDCTTTHVRLDLYPDHRYTLARLRQDEQGVSRTLDPGRWQTDAATHALLLSPEDGPPEDRWRVQDGDTLEAIRREPSSPASPQTLRRESAPVDASLANSYWQLIELDGRPVQAIDNQREPHLVLHTDPQRVSGAGGCNRLSGDYRRAEDRSLRFTHLASTSMACAEGMKTEQQFLQTLGQVTSFRLLGDYLILQDGDHHRLATFHAQLF